MFTCDQCDYKAKKKANVKRHVNAVHLKLKPFACLHCYLKFKSKRNMEGHVNAVHLKLKPFACPECNFKCSCSRGLQSHIKYKHKKMTARQVEPNVYCQHNRRSLTCKECNPVGHQASLIRNGIRRGLKSLGVSKDKRSKEILGCNFEELHLFLQAKIDHWNNTYGFISSKFLDGELDLDHIKPISLAKTKEEVEALSHYTNLQLIWKHVNAFKSNRWGEEDEKHWQDNIYKNPDHKNIYVPEICWSEVFK